MYYSINNLSNLRVVYGTDYVINIYHCPEKRENLKKIPNLVDVASGVFFVKITRTIGYLFFILQHKINKQLTSRKPPSAIVSIISPILFLSRLPYLFLRTRPNISLFFRIL